MRSSYLFWLALLAALSLELAAVLIPAGAKPPTVQAVPPARSVVPSLGLCEEAILKSPFPSRDAQTSLVAGMVQALEESRKRREKRLNDLNESEKREPGAEHHLMGWAVSDEVYWSQIPPAARSLPKDWSRLPLVRFTDTLIGGKREIRLLRGLEYDKWLLNDVERDIIACISVNRKTRRVYFMEIVKRDDGSWASAVAFDKCYSCHASGPRVIRPFDEPEVSRRTLERFNRLILSYGACDFGDSLDATVRGSQHGEARCAGCHDGNMRGRLYSVHEGSILFKTKKDMTMPPKLNRNGIQSE